MHLFLFEGLFWSILVAWHYCCLSMRVCACMRTCVCVFAFVHVCSNWFQWWHFHGFSMSGQRRLSLPPGYSGSDDHCFISRILKHFQAGRIEREKGKKRQASQVFPPFKVLSWKFPIVTSVNIWWANIVSHGFLIYKGGEVRKCF